jgi:hypothetical protein
MNLTCVLECPQCGGNIELGECDRLLPCPYCGVSNYLLTGDLPRYFLPTGDPQAEYLQVPYLRFRGSVFSCTEKEIFSRVLDFTTLGVPDCRFLPFTLGVRPQAMKLKFAVSGHPGRLLKNQVGAKVVLEKAAKQVGPGSSANIYHQALIGEATSLIYLPLRLAGNFISDGVTNDPLLALADAGDDFPNDIAEENIGWAPEFLPTICPECGWNLSGASNSVVMSCANCARFWLPTATGFQAMLFATVPTHSSAKVYLPFWQVEAQATGLELNTFHDFLTVTNQTHLLARSGGDKPLCFFTPAFKIRPDIYLKIATILTISQWQLPAPGDLFPASHFPVTLRPAEAAQSLNMLLVHSAADKKNILPALGRIEFKCRNTSLLFLPFADQGYNLYQQDTGLSINSRQLEFSHFL